MARSVVSLDLADARRIIDAGERKAIEIGIPYDIAVADAGGKERPVLADDDREKRGRLVERVGKSRDAERGAGQSAACGMGIVASPTGAGDRHQ